MRKKCLTLVKQTKPFYDVREFESVRDILDMAVELFGERPAFEIKIPGTGVHKNITYREYRSDINALGSALIAKGFSGARAAIVSDNRYEWCVAYMAVINGIGVAIPVDKELDSGDIYSILSASEATLIFCDTKALSGFDIDVLKDMGITAVCFDETDEPGVVSFNSLLDNGRRLLDAGNSDYTDAVIDTEKMCTLLFTSGTTGISKGVMLCQRNFCFEVRSAMSVIKIRPEDCGISMLPLHHTYESTIILFFAPYCGAKVTFCEGFKYVLKNMKEFSPSIFVSVPLVLETVHRRLLKEIRKKTNGELKFSIGKALCKGASKLGIDLKKIVFKEITDTFGGSMRLIICGGAPINPQILRDFDAFGIQILQGYGLTECAPLAIINHDRLHLAASIGVPLPNTDAKIINSDSSGVGEIAVRGPMVMLGYYKNREATDEVIDKEGYLHTGDLGYVDKKGHFYITGRSKNVIVTENGKNIYPEELEYLLSTHPVVANSMVYGDEPKEGQTVVSASIFPDLEEIRERLGIEPTDEAIHKVVSDVVERINSCVPPFKRIRQVVVRKTDFVQTTSRKIQRYKKENFNESD